MALPRIDLAGVNPGVTVGDIGDIPMPQSHPFAMGESFRLLTIGSEVDGDGAPSGLGATVTLSYPWMPRS